VLPAALDAVARVLQAPDAPARTYEEPGAGLAGPAPVVGRDGILTVPIVGELARKTYGLDPQSGLTSYDWIDGTLRAAARDPDVRGVLLEIDSPGGEVRGLFDLVGPSGALAALKAAGKPVVASTEGRAASAAYAIAAAADALYVSSTAGAGSVGVVIAHLDVSVAEAAAGIRWTFVHRGAEKIAGNPHEPLTDNARSKMQAHADRAYEAFVAQVADARGLEPAAVEATEANVYHGQEAVDVGLADHVGTLADARAHLEGLMKATEAQAAEMQAIVADRDGLAAKLQASEAQVAALTAKLAKHEAAELARAKQAEDDFVARISADAVSAGSPIQAEKLAQVRAFFGAGHTEAARTLGQAFLDAATASVAAPVEGTRSAIGATGGYTEAERLADFKARQEAAGVGSAA